MSAYFDENGKTWRYRTRVQLPNGNMVRISGSAPELVNTKAGAIGAEREHIARMLNPQAPTLPTGGPTFKEWSERYMEQATADQSSSERDGKRQKLASFLVPELGKLPIDKIGRMELDNLRTLLLRRDLQASTVNNYLSVVGAILRYAVKCGKLAKVPDLGLLDVADQPFEVYGDLELADLLRAHQGNVMMTCAILLGCDAGLRAGEIRALHRVNVGDGRLVVMHSDYNGELKCPKGKRSRTVPLTPRLTAALQAAMREHIGPRVLARANGLPWTKEVMRGNAPEKGWHALRHTFCTRLAARGVPATQIQALAGHASIKTTERYMHVAPNALQTAVMVLDDSPAENGNAPKAATFEAFAGQILAKEELTIGNF